MTRQTFNYEIPEVNTCKFLIFKNQIKLILHLFIFQEIENDKIFTADNIMLTTDGLITRLNEYDDDFENEEEVLNRLNGLIMNQVRIFTIIS